MPPVLPATAVVGRVLDIEHLRVIQSFIRDLPGDIPVPAVAGRGKFLAEKAAELRPDQLE